MLKDSAENEEVPMQYDSLLKDIIQQFCYEIDVFQQSFVLVFRFLIHISCNV